MKDRTMKSLIRYQIFSVSVEMKRRVMLSFKKEILLFFFWLLTYHFSPIGLFFLETLINKTLLDFSKVVVSLKCFKSFFALSRSDLSFFTKDISRVNHCSTIPWHSTMFFTEVSSTDFFRIRCSEILIEMHEV